jgi:hypothetical protein
VRRQHQPQLGDAAEQHADAYECPDDPDGARRPGPSNQDGEDQLDDSIEQQPLASRATQTAILSPDQTCHSTAGT